MIKTYNIKNNIKIVNKNTIKEKNLLIKIITNNLKFYKIVEI